MKRFLLFIHIILITNVLAYSQDSFRLMSSERIPVDSRYDDEVNKSDKRFLALYKSRMDRQLNTMVANASSPIEADDPAGNRRDQYQGIVKAEVFSDKQKENNKKGL